MSFTIHKYPLRAVQLQEIDMPCVARLLTVQVQHDQPCLWALVDPSSDIGKRRVRIYATGEPIDVATAGLRYLATFQLHGGALVFHAFEETP